jgi:hypothetical protein
VSFSIILWVFARLPIAILVGFLAITQHSSSAKTVLFYPALTREKWKVLGVKILTEQQVVVTHRPLQSGAVRETPDILKVHTVDLDDLTTTEIENVGEIIAEKVFSGRQTILVMVTTYKEPRSGLPG